MRYIAKHPPLATVASMTLWASARVRTWEEFKGRRKERIKEALLAEQGFLCCYCGDEIDDAHSHIDHVWPQGLAVFRHLTFDYGNMLASCLKDKPRAPQPSHCGHHRGSWYDNVLFIHPLQSDCADHFEYQSSGRVIPAPASTNQAGAKETIDRLGLDIPKLRRARGGVMNVMLGLDPPLDPPPTRQDIERQIAALERPNRKGRLDRFSPALVAYLKQELARLSDPATGPPPLTSENDRVRRRPVRW